MLCRTHSPVAPQHGHGAGAGEEGWLPAGWLCPALPVPGAACSPPRSLGGGGIFFLVGTCLPAGVQRNYFPLKCFPGMQALDVLGDYLD